MTISGVGERIKQAREAAGMTQRSVSIDLDVSEGTVQAWEYERANLTLERAVQLSRLYEVSIDWIANGDSSDHTDPLLRDLQNLLKKHTEPQ